MFAIGIAKSEKCGKRIFRILQDLFSIDNWNVLSCNCVDLFVKFRLTHDSDVFDGHAFPRLVVKGPVVSISWPVSGQLIVGLT